MSGLPQGFRLDLSAVTKSQAQTLNPEPAKEEQVAPAQGKPVNPTRGKKLLDKKALAATVSPQKPNSSINPARGGRARSDSDSDLDLDEIAEIPVGKEPEPIKRVESVTDVPLVQVNALPDLDEIDDSDDGGAQSGGEHKYSLLTDLMLTREQFEEPQSEWTYKGFIKQFAKTEASEDGDFDEEDEDDMEYEEEEEY